MNTAYELIIGLAKEQLAKPNIIPGCNGPHNHPETDVRNSCHWAITYFNCYKWTNEGEFLLAGQQLLDSILDAHKKSGHSSLHQRSIEGKDKCNGLIGPAWAIEALLAGNNASKSDVYKNQAIELFLKHSYNSDFHLWHIHEIDGRDLELDPTFNHQLWFAAAIAPAVKDNAKVKELVYDFLSHLPQNLTILNNGLIFHGIDRNLNNPKLSSSSLKKILLKLSIRPSHLIWSLKKDPSYMKQINMSYGYQLFNLYAFAHLKNHLPKDAPWHVNLDKSLALLHKNSFKKRLLNNPYSYAYNAPGFEAPYIQQYLGSQNQNMWSQEYLDNQIKNSFDNSSATFSANTNDPHTLTARIYELSQVDAQLLKSLKL